MVQVVDDAGDAVDAGGGLGGLSGDADNAGDAGKTEHPSKTVLVLLETQLHPWKPSYLHGGIPFSWIL